MDSSPAIYKCIINEKTSLMKAFEHLIIMLEYDKRPKPYKIILNEDAIICEQFG